MIRKNLVLGQRAVDRRAQHPLQGLGVRACTDIVQRQMRRDAVADRPLGHVRADSDDLACAIAAGDEVGLNASWVLFLGERDVFELDEGS